MKTLRNFRPAALVAALALAAGLAAIRPAAAQDAAPATPAAPSGPPMITENEIIAGTMEIEFGTRTNLDNTGELVPGSPALGAKDEYKFAFRVAKTTEFAGTITRQPNLYSDTLRVRKQEAEMTFDITLSVLNPNDMKQKRTVGKWVGLVPIDTTEGAFALSGGGAKERPLRIAIDAVGKQKAFTDSFDGLLLGKAEKKEGLGAYTYKRLVGKKTVEVVVKNSDPMKFSRLTLAKGPADIYPRTTVNGRLDYDYETGNWLTDGIQFRYNLDGSDYSDKISGMIKWVEDPDRESNGKGFYDLNLRFNEEQHQVAATEGDMFAELSGEEAFFAVDNTIPCLTGTISYEDTFIPGGDTPASSKVTYSLHANKLTKQQVMNFFKLWILCIGPTNDE